jgi:hypothetical protein
MAGGAGGVAARTDSGAAMSLQLAVDDGPGQPELGALVAIDQGDQPLGELQAVQLDVVGQLRLDGHVTEVGVGGRGTDAARQARGGVYRQRERAGGRQRDVDQPLAAFGAGIGESRPGRQRGPHQHQRVVVHLGETVLRDLCGGARRIAIGTDAVGHLAVESEGLRLRRLALVVEKVRRAGLPHVHAAGAKVEGPSIARDREGLARRVHGHVLADVPVGAFALQGQGGHGHHAVATAQRLGGIRQRLLFRWRRRARRGTHRQQGEQQEGTHARDNLTGTKGRSS